jgi:hypothetical protein
MYLLRLGPVLRIPCARQPGDIYDPCSLITLVRYLFFPSKMLMILNTVFTIYRCASLGDIETTASFSPSPNLCLAILFFGMPTLMAIPLQEWGNES